MGKWSVENNFFVLLFSNLESILGIFLIKEHLENFFAKEMILNNN